MNTGRFTKYAVWMERHPAIYGLAVGLTVYSVVLTVNFALGLWEGWTKPIPYTTFLGVAWASGIRFLTKKAPSVDGDT